MVRVPVNFTINASRVCVRVFYIATAAQYKHGMCAESSLVQRTFSLPMAPNDFAGKIRRSSLSGHTGTFNDTFEYDNNFELSRRHVVGRVLVQRTGLIDNVTYSYGPDEKYSIQTLAEPDVHIVLLQRQQFALVRHPFFNHL